MTAGCEMNGTRILVICHGKTEYLMCRHIKSNLKLRMEVYANQNGKSSIQITSLMNVLNNRIFSSKKRFCDTHNVEYTKGYVPVDFRIYIIMDTDDCTQKQLDDYKSKYMFAEHWLCDFIVPIFNTQKIEDVLKKSGVQYPKNKKDYIKLFPIQHGGVDYVQVDTLKKQLCKAGTISNLHEFLQACLENYKDFS